MDSRLVDNVAMDEIAQEAETTAAGWWAVLATAAEDVREQVGVAVTRIGGVVVISTRDDPDHFWNKAVGFTEPVTATLVDEVVAFLRAEGPARAALQIVPELLPPDWDEICSAHGLTPGGKLARLATTTVQATGRTHLRIERITDYEHWAATVFTAFGMSDKFAPILVDVSRANPDYRSFGAWDGDKLVGVGSVYIRDDVAYMNTGATLAEYRNHGVQSALIAARLREASGCRMFVTDTSAEPNPSLSNMRRAGFTQVGTPQNWIWQP
jgi:GNAT superfamily N-acetyltransferase